MVGHVLYGHCSGSPQRTTRVRVCKGSMILPLLFDRKTVLVFFPSKPADRSVMRMICVKRNYHTSPFPAFLYKFYRER
jgi:hypothetical protein